MIILNTPITEYEQQLIKFRRINVNVNTKFSYLKIDDNTKNKLLEQAFDKFLQNLNNINEDNISLEIEKYLNNEYINLLKDLLKKDNNKEILNNYTNNYFINNKCNTNIEKLLETFTDNLLSLNANISYEECLYLIKNNEFLKTLFPKIIYLADNKPDLFKIDKLLQTNLSILLEPFCQYHNIDVEMISSLQNEDNDYDNYLTDDILNDYLHSLPPILTPEEEKRLFLALANGNSEVKDYIIEHNLKFVVSIAKHYRGRGLSFMDLIQEGNIGLIKAVDRFDVTKGFKFVSYASWWIRQSIIASINETGRTIRLPAYVSQKLQKIERLRNYVSNNLGHYATNKEVAEYIGTTEKKLNDFLIETSDSVSYNTFAGEDEENEMQDFLEADINIEEDFIKKDLKSQIIPALKKLSFREQVILIERTANKKSLSYIAQKLNITRERVRQIEEKALVKLRDIKEIKDIMIYLDNPENISLPDNKLTLFKTIGSKKNYVLAAIDYLTFEEKQYLLNIYGENYENKVKLNYSEELNELIIKLKVFVYALKNSEKITNIADNLFSYFNGYEKDNILDAINSLSSNKKKLLNEKYPNGFDNKPLIFPITYEHYIKREVFGKISKILKENKTKVVKKSTNIITLNSLKEAFSKLTEEEKDYLLKHYKISSKETYYLENLLNISKDAPFLKLVEYANNIENTNKFNLDIKTSSFLSLTNAISIEELKYHLTFLLPSEINLLKIRFGKNFLQEIKLHDIDYSKKRRIVTKIIPKINERIIKLRTPLEDVLNVNNSIVKKAITYFEEDDQKLIYTLYNYENYNYVLIEEDYIRLVTKLLPVLKNITTNLQHKGVIAPNTSMKLVSLYATNITLRFNTSKENLQEIILHLSKEEQTIFYKVFGPNLDEYNTNLTTDEAALYKNISVKINKIINKQNKERESDKEDLEKIKEVYLSLNEETTAKLTKNDRVLLNNLFLENKNLNTSLQKDYLIALKNILEISKDSNIDENNKQYLKCIASYIENQTKSS